MHYILSLLVGLLFLLAYYKVRQNIKSKEKITSNLNAEAKKDILKFKEKYQINYTPFGSTHGFCSYINPYGTVFYIHSKASTLYTVEKAKYKESTPDALKNISILKFLSYAINIGDIKERHV